MPTTSTIVSRLQLEHPDLGHDGGVALHTKVRTGWTKLGDNMNSRFFTVDALADTASQDFEHNFKTAFAELRPVLFLRDTGTGELTRINALSTPPISDFVIAATPGFLTTKTRVTNNSGSPVDIALVLVHGRGPESIDDLDDVVISGPGIGEVLTYDGSDWTNQAPAASKNFTMFVGSAEAYTTLSAAIAAASPGDSILVVEDTTEPAGDVNVNVADLRIEWMPGAVTTLSGALTNGLRLTAARAKLFEMGLKLEPSGAQSRGLSIEAADCEVSGTIELNTAQTLTDAVHLTAAGTLAYVSARAKATLGALTNLLTNNGGAGSQNVWG